ncbi:MAG: DoxX family protein [Saprospiraceae bacterium]
MQKDIVDLIARVLLSFIFIFDAIDSIKFRESTIQQMAEYGLTWNPHFLLNLGIGCLILGGLMLLLGYRSSFGAFLLLLYWVPVTVIVHSYWNEPLNLQREQSLHFMKNLAITGGLLLVYVNGSGKYSIRRLFATTRVNRKFWD